MPSSDTIEMSAIRISRTVTGVRTSRGSAFAELQVRQFEPLIEESAERADLDQARWDGLAMR